MFVEFIGTGDGFKVTIKIMWKPMMEFITKIIIFLIFSSLVYLSL